MGYQNNYRGGYAPVGGKRYQQQQSSGYGIWCKFISVGLLLGLVGTFMWNKSNGSLAAQQDYYNAPKADDAWSNENEDANGYVDNSQNVGDSTANTAIGIDDDGDGMQDDDNAFGGENDDNNEYDVDDDDDDDDNQEYDADNTEDEDDIVGDDASKNGEDDDFNEPAEHNDVAPEDAAGGDATEDLLEQTVEEVLVDLEDIEAKELEADEEKIMMALDSVISRVRDDVLAFVGDSMSEGEVTSLMEETEEHLRTHVSEELEAAAKEAVVDVAERVVGFVDGEMEDGDNLKDIDSDLHMHEGEALSNLRAMIKEAESNIEETLYLFALQVEKDTLERRISELVGEPVVFVIQDNKLSDPDNFLIKLGREDASEHEDATVEIDQEDTHGEDGTTDETDPTPGEQEVAEDDEATKTERADEAIEAATEVQTTEEVEEKVEVVREGESTTEDADEGEGETQDLEDGGTAGEGEPTDEESTDEEDNEPTGEESTGEDEDVNEDGDGSGRVRRQLRGSA